MRVFRSLSHFDMVCRTVFGFNPVLLTLPADPTGIRCLPLARAPAPRLPENRNHLIDLDCAPRPFQLCPLMRISLTVS